MNRRWHCNDTVSGAVKLSAASSAKVPELGIESNDAARRKCVYTYNKAPTTGYMINFNYANPIIHTTSS